MLLQNHNCLLCQVESIWNSGGDPLAHYAKCKDHDRSTHICEDSPSSLDAALDLLEIIPFRNLNAAIVPAQLALQITEKLGIEALNMRARLIHADVISRQGRVADGGRIFHEVNKWAHEQQNRHVMACSHRQLASFYRRIGDNTSAFEHAVRALDYSPDTMLPYTRAEHLLILSLTLDENGAYDDSAQRYQEVLNIAKDAGDYELSLITLNNMAFTAYELNDAAVALELMEQLRQLSQTYKIQLDALYLDTIARIEILLGRPADAEVTLTPVLHDLTGRLLIELTSLPECLLTAVTAQRLQGKLESAQSTLDKARHICEEHDLSVLRVQVRLEQAQLFAAAGRYREAYEEHRSFHAENEELRLAERESRSRILRGLVDAEEARRDSEHYREMALRDPLTGLHNRRYIDAHLEELIENVALTGQPLSAAIIDLDNFKQINDTLSHEVGDAVLVHFAKILTVTVMETAEVARIGGEEFVILFPEVSEDAAFRSAEEIRMAVKSANWRTITGELPVTVSIGVCTVRGSNINRAQLLSAADQNLYSAKRTGKDKVIATSLS
ncbi:diguanylate cyclase [Peribacillus sp. SCS-155]|uniref:tetratricopeptide repeat-containing diguanylate cyclase n=1 Tax=Peribacillus sedimenti TaxID=3115297 RepID=UPI0039057EE3